MDFYQESELNKFTMVGLVTFMVFGAGVLYVHDMAHKRQDELLRSTMPKWTGTRGPAPRLAPRPQPFKQDSPQVVVSGLRPGDPLQPTPALPSGRIASDAKGWRPGV